MTKTIKRTLSIILAAMMLFSFNIISFTIDDLENEAEKFSLTSATVSAYSGDFKSQRVYSIKLTVVTDAEILVDSSFGLTITAEDSTNLFLDEDDIISVDYTDDGATVILNYDDVISHEPNYNFSLNESSFVSDGRISEQFDFEVNGNLILESLNVNRPSTTMQRLINWLESWKYAKYIQFIIDILKWFDTL